MHQAMGEDETGRATMTISPLFLPIPHLLSVLFIYVGAQLWYSRLLFQKLWCAQFGVEPGTIRMGLTEQIVMILLAIVFVAGFHTIAAALGAGGLLDLLLLAGNIWLVFLLPVYAHMVLRQAGSVTQLVIDSLHGLVTVIGVALISAPFFPV